MQLLLVVGPTCEEKYGSRVLLRLLVITAVASAATHMVFSADATVLMVPVALCSCWLPSIPSSTFVSAAFH